MSEHVFVSNEGRRRDERCEYCYTLGDTKERGTEERKLGEARFGIKLKKVIL